MVDKQALMRALAESALGGVGLDVHWTEPADPDEELYRDPRVLALPHMGTITHEASAPSTRPIVRPQLSLRKHRAC